MNNNKPTAFISYSWDNIEHQQWVFNLTNRLRTKGIVATMDLFETQQGTVNLNQMMIKNIKESDYVVIVLTEEYAKKSDNFQGGVGFETMLTIPDIKNNLDKLIFIMRHNGDYTKVFPYHLRDVYAIDFSDDSQFETKFEELIYKIHNIPLYEMQPVGEIPALKPKKSLIQNDTITKNDSDDIYDLLIPNLKEITDVDKNQFIKDSYKSILGDFKYLLNKSKELNSNFSYEFEEITTRKAIIKICINGSIKVGIKMWYGSSMGMRQNSIYLSYGTWVDENNDSIMNEIINCVVTESKELKLDMMMNFAGNNKKLNADEVAKKIWMDHVKNCLQY